jgi:hypothetical protein
MSTNNDEEFTVDVRITARRGRGNQVSTIRIEASMAGLDRRVDVEKALTEVAETVKRLPRQSEGDLGK